ncbi:MAG: tRNA (adenosine(37)-N6)-threonylcarbamoyltransferase complex ATPase subunit type 1 TsaE [Armatimonadetes bacterium]|nr:tRNA (adenosine(37)-N6)-threonylcarbamoyltransferase complex ATPase subunit type 1 TsaE [Armatimonadota bacterium]
MTRLSKTFYTYSSEETELLGEQIGRALQPGVVVALIGELGAGKTTLTKGIARGLGVTDLVHSPTFTLIHEHKGRVPVYHFDLYRLESHEEMEDLDYESYFRGEGVTIIEWAEKIPGILPSDRLEIRISEKNSTRRFDLIATGTQSEEVLGRIST